MNFTCSLCGKPCSFAEWERAKCPSLPEGGTLGPTTPICPRCAAVRRHARETEEKENTRGGYSLEEKGR